MIRVSRRFEPLMTLTEKEKKVLILSIDAGATLAETEAAAAKLLLLLRKRYSDGYSLINDLETLAEPNRFGEYVLRFGKYKGKRLAQVPVEYLTWALATVKLFPPVKAAIEGWLNGKTE